MSEKSMLDRLIGAKIKGRKIKSPTNEAYEQLAQEDNKRLRSRPSSAEGYDPNILFKDKS